jgi:rfaE bifunctional protein nucleotidyltransferase chain/domain
MLPVFFVRSVQLLLIKYGMVSSSISGVVQQQDVVAFRQKLRLQNRRVVMTNGCFDLLHVGHLRYLTAARALGDFLWIGLNADSSVRELKGSSRPINSEQDRAEVLAALRVIDAVTIFPEKRATELIKLMQPDVYAKGGDYTVESLDSEERAALQLAGAEIIILPLVPGKSTTAMIERSRI